MTHSLKVTCRFCVILLFTAATLFMGCSKRYHDLPAFSAFPVGDPENRSVGRFKTSYMAQQIDAYYRGNIQLPIAVATFVDIDNLYTSSTFGRVLSEQLMSELAMLGYQVVELRQSDALQVLSTEGELGLSRDVSTLRNGHEVGGLIVGTYAVSPIRVYLNTRLIDPSSSMVLSVGSVELEKTSEIAKLLRANSAPQSLERIPVRGLSMAPSVVTPSVRHMSGTHAVMPIPEPSMKSEALGNSNVAPKLPAPKLQPNA